MLEARQKAGLTQREVAKRLNKPAAFPHKVEHAEREINIVELMDYCEALGLGFEQFAAEVGRAVRELRRSTGLQSAVDPHRSEESKAE